jgi:hypothetical protein
VVTKHPNTGGMVTVHTVTEQLLYEMGAPEYLAPDCIARFDSIQLEQDGPDRVKVSGIRGAPMPEKLKVSCSFSDDYRAFGRLILSGPDVLAKTQKVDEVFWESVGGKENYEQACSQVIGYDACHPTLASEEPSEVILQLAVRDADQKKINRVFGPQVVPKVLSTVPGITYLGDQGRPRASEVVGYWPALISRERMNVRVVVGDETREVPQTDLSGSEAPPFEPTVELPAVPGGETTTVPLEALCLARSGDKGDTCNVGLLARSPEIYSWIRETVTPAFVKERFGDVVLGEIDRFEVPNLLALNFLLHESLGGGGTLSLLLDPQGKTFAQFLLATPVEAPKALLETI